MYTRGSVVLEVALIIGMFGAIATFTTLHQEVARVQAEAQYAQAATAQSGGASAGGAGTTGGQSGEQRVCVNGEKYEATIKDGKAQFKQVTSPLTTQPAQPCLLTFEVDPNKHTTATVQVPPGGNLDKAQSNATALNEKSTAFSSAAVALQEAQKSGDATAIQTAANNALTAGRELNQALDTAYAGNTQDPVYQAASGSTATALGALREITQDPSTASGSDIERVTRGLSSIEAARVATLGAGENTARLSDANNGAMDPLNPNSWQQASQFPEEAFGGAQRINEQRNPIASNGSTFGDGLPTTDSVAEQLPPADGVSISQQEREDNRDQLYLQEYGNSAGQLRTAANARIATAEENLQSAQQTLRQAECSRNASFSCMFNSGYWRSEPASDAEMTQAQQTVASAQYELERARQFRANPQAPVVTSRTTAEVSYDYGGSGVNTNTANINTGGVVGITQNTVSALNAAVSEVRQSISGLPAFVGSGYQYIVQNITGNTNTGSGNSSTGSTNTTNTGNTNTTNTGNTTGGNTGNPPGNNTGNPPGAGQYPYNTNTGGMAGAQQAQCQALQQRCTPYDQSGCGAYAQLCGGGAGMGGMNMPRPAAGSGGASGSSQQQQNVCARYPGTTLQNGQCACASGQSWNGSACAAANVCAQYPGTILQNNQCTCPTGQNWNGSQCATDTTSGLRAELVCAPQTQEVGEPIAISWMCQNATNKRADGFTVDESANVLSGTAQVTASTTAGQSAMQFSLTCLREGQTHQAQCSVEVVKPFIVLVATPSTIASGGSVRVGWVTGGMRNTSDACTLTSEELPSIVHTATAGVVDIPNIIQETTFTLTCTTRTGGSKTGEVTVSLE